MGSRWIEVFHAADSDLGSSLHAKGLEAGTAFALMRVAPFASGILMFMVFFCFVLVVESLR